LNENEFDTTVEKILFMVKRNELSDSYFLTYAHNREYAKRDARPWFGGDMDTYIVTPLTLPGAQVHLHLTLYV